MTAHHRRDDPSRSGVPRFSWLVIVPVALVSLVMLIWLWPTGDPQEQTQGGSGLTEVEGHVIAVQRQECAEELPDDVNGCGTARVRLDGADAEAQDVDVPLPNGAGAPEVDEGDDVVLVGGASTGDGYTIVDHQRGRELWLLAAVFAVALAVVGRWRGVTALAGLAVTFALLVFFVVPAILAGESPLLVALVGATVIMLTVLYLTHGFGPTTTVALLGTLASFTITGLLAAVTVPVLHLTGITDDISMAVQTTHGVDMEGLLIAGIVIGSLGVLDDVTVTQAATVSELVRANPHYRAGELYRAAHRVGRSHIASVVNTIVLAYAGSSLPLLILTVADNDSLRGVVTDQFVTQEIVRSVVATLGLVAAVPITTGLAALTLREARG